MWKKFSWIKFIDKVATVFIRIGGLSVVLVIISIFAYLLYEILPIFSNRHIALNQTFQVSSSAEEKTLLINIDDQNQLYALLTDFGNIYFHKVQSGELAYKLKLPLESKITSVYDLFYEGKKIFVVGTDDGKVLFVKLSYVLDYDEALKKNVTPKLVFPYGETPIEVSDNPVTHISFSQTDDELDLVAHTLDKKLLFVKVSQEEDLFEDDLSYNIEKYSIKDSIELSHLLISRNFVFFAQGKQLSVLDLSQGDFPIIQTLASKSLITKLQFLLGSSSILQGDESGVVSQLFMVQEGDQFVLKNIRQFQNQGSSIANILSESQKKSFITLAKNGRTDIFHTTSENHTLGKNLKTKPCVAGLSPNSKLLFLQECQKKQIHTFNIQNSYSDISFTTLWARVWYENYEKPDYIWQSSSAANDFEPKYSLMPLLFGTFKATFYSILFATPLAVFGAMYVGFFISSSMRKAVKPLIELMQAFPTVILGFLAGLYFAPIFEKILLNILLALIFLPVGIILFSLLVHYVHNSLKKKFMHGFEFLWILPVLLFLIYLSSVASNFLELNFFEGDFNLFITESLGFDYDQRNALVVSFIMGLAVVPIIFSITEDAIFNVPKSLTYGSLALGANYWQTLVKVVFPTAAPSFFSAVMIGIGRAFGETMIILMATGNTPIMDMNLFEGMRTFSANLAVELPEAEIGSSHYRILFLTTLVLFVFSFIFNTIAEIISTRLRKKYSEL